MVQTSSSPWKRSRRAGSEKTARRRPGRMLALALAAVTAIAVIVAAFVLLSGFGDDGERVPARTTGAVPVPPTAFMSLLPALWAPRPMPAGSPSPEETIGVYVGAGRPDVVAQ